LFSIWDFHLSRPEYAQRASIIGRPGARRPSLFAGGFAGYHGTLGPIMNINIESR
jgi:hypothetical protein